MNTRPILLDFESRSHANLKAIGGRLYWAHPSTEALCCAWYDTADDSAGVWVPGTAWPHAGRVCAAHNAMFFDRFGAERYGFGATSWIDTSQLARKAGLPGKLDALGVMWCGVPKDAAASKYTKSLSAIKRPKTIAPAQWAALPDDRKRDLSAWPPVDLPRVIEYCISDVTILALAWPRLAQWLEIDADACAVDLTINDRGVAFDSALALRLLDEDSRNGKIAVAQAKRIWPSLSEAEIAAAALSPQQFCAITGAPDAQGDTVAALDHPLARVREALATIAGGKLCAGLLRASSDGRMRDSLKYYGAHTGRWSGQGMQPHNLTRPDKQFEDLPEDTAIPYTIVEGKRLVDVDRFADAVLAGQHCDNEAVSLLVRATLCAPPGMSLIACDFSSVEARGTAWAAGDSAALEVFRSKRDPYKVAATAVFGTDYDQVTKPQRQVGKVCELALGYQGARDAFANMARQYRVSIEGLDVDAIVAAWRKLHAPIVDLWYACARAFASACRGAAQWAGPFEFVPADDRDAVACFLPSGRPIVYNQATSDGRRNHSYTGARGVERVYGGKLVENAIQAMCRDLLSDALVKVEREGMRPVLTVHDEIVCEVPEANAQAAYDRLRAIMLDQPAWSAGMPLEASGWVGKRYRK